MKRTFLIDCDGTICLHDFPEIHKEVPHAIRVIKRMQDYGHTLILLTMRYGDHLSEAQRWLLKKGLYFDYFNRNPDHETGSRKVYGHHVIDDHNLGIKLIYDTTIHHKPFVDWLELERILEEKGLL
jgi:hypothetical protein